MVPSGVLRLLQLDVLRQDLRLRLVEHAVEAAEDRERKDDRAVVGLLVVPRRRSATDHRKLVISEKPLKLRGEGGGALSVVAPFEEVFEVKPVTMHRESTTACR